MGVKSPFGDLFIKKKNLLLVYWKRCPLLGRPNDGDVAKSIEDSGTIGSSGYRRRSQPMTSQTDEERNKKKQCQLWGAQQERESE